MVLATLTLAPAAFGVGAASAWQGELGPLPGTVPNFVSFTFRADAGLPIRISDLRIGLPAGSCRAGNGNEILAHGALQSALMPEPRLVDDLTGDASFVSAEVDRHDHERYFHYLIDIHFLRAPEARVPNVVDTRIRVVGSIDQPSGHCLFDFKTRSYGIAQL